MMVKMADDFRRGRCSRWPVRFCQLAAGFLLVAWSAEGNRLWGKESRSFYTEELVAQAREKVEQHDWAQRQQLQMEERVGWILEMSDQELWDFVPPLTQLRALNVAFNVGCPVHGQEVFRKGGHYPWIMSRERPFKVECPVGGEVYPTNNFVPWHHGGKEGEVDTTEEYVDDGTGYEGPDGQRYYFVAHYIFWQRWRGDILPRLNDLRDLYLLTGDKRYARAATILLSRIAADYPEVDYATQAVHRRNPAGIPGGILDYIWENGGVVDPSASTYDAVFPVLEDPEVVAFVRGQGIGDVRRHIEDNLLGEMVKKITGGRNQEREISIRGNFGMYQRSLAMLAVVLQNEDPERGLTTDEKVDWIMAPGAWTNVGQLSESLWNRFYRDGHGGEASPGYSAGGAIGLATIAQLLEKLGYNLFEHPKMRRIVEAPLDLAVLGEWTPSIGDSGDIFGSRRVGWSSQLLAPAFKAMGEPRWAKALSMIGVADNQLWKNVPLDEINAAAEEYGEWPTGGTRHLGGYGLAIAESPASPTGLALYYGYAGGGHGHRDRLNIEMFAFDRPVLPQHGYPTPLGTVEEAPKRFYWTSSTISQYGVVVNRKWQQTVDRGRLESLVSSAPLQLVEASADHSAYPDEASLYRRTSLLVENPGGEPYLIDLFRVAGGWEHAWSFHGPPFPEFETFGLDLGPAQEEGTLAGENIAFGEEPGGETDKTSGFQYLFNVRRADAPAEPWGATWSKPDEDIHLRLTSLPTSVDEVVLADAEPELKPNHPETMPYLLAFNTADGAELASDFAAVVEPHRGAPTLSNIRRLQTDGPPHAVGLAIQRQGGGDLVISHLFSDEHSTSTDRPGGPELRLEGKLAFLSLEAGLPRAFSLVDARGLETPWLSLQTEGPLEGEIAAVNYQANTVTLDGRIGGADALVGSTVIIGNDLHQTSYEISGVSEAEDRTVLHFGPIPMIVGIGQVSDVDPEAGNLTTSTEFGFLQVDGGKHEGRRLLDESRHSAHFIDGFDGKIFRLRGDRTQLEKDFRGDGDEPAQLWIGDVGSGDRWTIPATVWMEKKSGREGRYDLGTNVAARVELRVPSGLADDWEFLDANGKWQRLDVVRRQDRIEFSIAPDMIAEGKTGIRPRKR